MSSCESPRRAVQLVEIVHRSPIRVTFKNAERALARGYTEWRASHFPVEFSHRGLPLGSR